MGPSQWLFQLTAGLTTPWPNCNFCGWGGVGWGWWHSLNLNTWWMLRNCACLVIAHMVDATQQSWGRIGSRLIRDKSAGRPFIRTCHCHIYWMHLRSISLPWALGPSRWHGETYRKSFAAATKPPDEPSFGGICLVVFVQNERAAEVAWSTGQIGPKSKQCYKIEKKTSFFRRRLLIRTNSIVYSFLKTRTHGKMGRNQHMNQQTIHGIQHPRSISCIFNQMPC